MKGTTNASNKPTKRKIGSHIHHSNTHNNNNNFEKNSFQIWEKIYLEQKQNIEDEYIENEYLSHFFKSSKSILIKNYLYIFPLLKSDNKYAIIDLSKNILYFHTMPYQCFHPMYSPKFFFSIFLFFVDTSFKSDGRYDLIEFDIKNNSFNILSTKGVAPKERKNFSCFFYMNKIYFFGGLPLMLVDDSLNYIYSYNIKEKEWNIEESNFINDKENINGDNYIGNNFDNSLVQVNDKNMFYSIGGKYINDLLYSEFNNIGFGYMNKFKESNDIIKIYIKDNGNIELSNVAKNNNKNIFGEVCSLFYKDNIYIYNKDDMFLFDYNNKEILLLQKRMFAPEIEGNINMFIYEKYLYLLGKFKHFDDCYLFRTNLDKINTENKESQKINYENILNYNKEKDINDILCEFNNQDDKKIYLNKIFLSNFSSNIRNILNNNKFQNHINFININYQDFLIIIKWIFNNFEENISNLSNDNYKNIFNFFIKYKAKSLINIFISKININENNALFLYELGNKLNLSNLSSKSHNYISKNLGTKNTDKILSSNNASKEFKQKLYENYFCEHKLYIECMTNNLDIHNDSNSLINNEQLNIIKNLNKNGKLFYCLNCYKVFIPNVKEE